MAISIDWGTRVIYVPKDDMVIMRTEPTEIRQLSIDTFRQALNELQDTLQGITFPNTHAHNKSIDLGGVIIARVIEMINDYTVTFEDGQYAVNLVGANSNILDKTNLNQVSVRSANSAGLQDFSTLLAATYNGEVVFSDLGQPGIATPIGTRSTPCSSFADSIVIARRLGVSRIQLASSGTLTEGDVATGKVFGGDNPSIDQLQIRNTAEVADCSFENLIIRGTLDGNNTFRNCTIGQVSYVNGLVQDCSLTGPIAVDGGAQCNIINCWSGLAGVGDNELVTIDMSSSDSSLALRNYSGGIKLMNYTGVGSITLDFASGRVVIDQSCTGGVIGIRGVCEVTDNSPVGCTVLNQTLAGGLSTINDGVKKASLLIPHAEDLT
tara:strand:- start:1083 stop:2222 length:1140 start_codon:yes stop_codon:yes gene_type:complete